MSTIVRKLNLVEGVNITTPSQNGFSATKLESYASDAAFVAAKGAAAATGDIYWNTTSKTVRQFNGVDWQYDKTYFSWITDSTATGSDQDYTPDASNQVTRFTSNTLVSIRTFIAGNQGVIVIVNDQSSQSITLVNASAGGTASNRILTGTGADFVIPPNGGSVILSYDEDVARWRIIARHKDTTALRTFATDAAFVTAKGSAAGTGDIYWNTTSKTVRQHNGVDWQYDKTYFSWITDTTATGSDQDYTPDQSNQVTRFTSNTLVSIRTFVVGNQGVIVIVNDQASQSLTLVNASGGGTAANRILTGTGQDFIIPPQGGSAVLAYDEDVARWRIVAKHSGDYGQQSIRGLMWTIIGGAAANFSAWVAANVLRIRGGSGGFAVDNTSGNAILAGTDAGNIDVGPVAGNGVYATIKRLFRSERTANFNVGATTPISSTQITASVLNSSYLRLVTATGAFNFDGMIALQDGTDVEIENQTGQTMTVRHNGAGEGTAANQILTGTAGSITFPDGTIAKFKYSNGKAKWLLTNKFA